MGMEEDGAGEEQAGECGFADERSLDAMRKAYIEQVLQTVGYDYNKAAVLLEISAGRLRRLMATLGITTNCAAPTSDKECTSG